MFFAAKLRSELSVKVYRDYVSNMDGEFTGAPSKKRRVSEQRYKLDYNVEWPIITRSKLDDFHAYCMLCKADFSVRHGGRHDVEKHTRTGKHQSYKAAMESTRPIAGFLTLDKDTSVINAEVLAVDFLVEHNIPIAVADHIGPLVKKMFPDSKIAGKAQMTNSLNVSLAS